MKWALIGVVTTARLAWADTDVLAVDTVDKVRELCAATRPAERASVVGDAVERGIARRAHEERREKLMDTAHAVVIPADGFVLGEYDPKERELPIETKKVWRAVGGVLSIYAAAAEDVAVEKVDETAARAIADAKKAGRAQLGVTFLPADVDEGPCVSSAGGKAFTLAVEPLVLEIFDGGKLLARTETPAYQEFLAQQPAPVTGTPVVEVTSAAVEGAAPSIDEVRTRVAASKKALAACYQKGLDSKPALAGTVVLGFAIGRDGKAANIEPITDSLREAAVTECAAGVLKGVAFPGKAAARASVTLSFSRR